MPRHNWNFIYHRVISYTKSEDTSDWIFSSLRLENIIFCKPRVSRKKERSYRNQMIHHECLWFCEQCCWFSCYLYLRWQVVHLRKFTVLHMFTTCLHGTEDRILPKYYMLPGSWSELGSKLRSSSWNTHLRLIFQITFLCPPKAQICTQKTHMHTNKKTCIQLKFPLYNYMGSKF